jgi:hypothetical protein
MNAVSTPGSTACPDPVVFESPQTSSAHAELVSICERLARVWSQRVDSEGEQWDKLKLELAAAPRVEQALRAYSEHAAQRMRMALEDAQRIFEEHRTIVARFSQPPG